MTDWAKLAAVDTTAIALVIAHRVGRTSIAAHTVPINQTVGDELRGIVSAVVDEYRASKVRPWTVETSWEADECYLVPHQRLNDRNPLLAALEAVDIPFGSPAILRAPSLLLYAIVAGRGDNRILFIRKANPRLSAMTKVFAVLGREQLAKVEEPLFSFDYRCDMILVPGRGVIAFAEGPFDLLFRDSPELQARLMALATDLAPDLMAEDSARVLAAAAARSARVRRRVTAISERGHLQKVSAAELRDEFHRLDQDPDIYLVHGKLVITNADVLHVLAILNEDRFQGGLSHERFEAERKRRAG